MKSVIFILLIVSLLACSKQDNDNVNVTVMDQLNGSWEWVSTCGGLIQTCAYSSSEHYAVISFGSNGKYVEYWNDTIYLEANYSITQINDSSAMLRINSNKYESPVTVVNNQLEIGLGELVVTYKKIK